MVLNKLRKSIVGDIGDSDMPREEFVEVGMDGTSAAGKIGITIDKLVDFSDTERVLRSVRNGSLVFLKIRDLKDKDLGELKRAVEKLKKTVLAQNGDIVGVEQDWLILAPEVARLER
jgi:SepF-like predicted cell division protein (DUF552 family)